jgi:hypothetical protein
LKFLLFFQGNSCEEQVSNTSGFYIWLSQT